MNDRFLRWGWLLLSACLYGLLAYNIPRDHFSALIGLYALLFWGYSLRIRQRSGTLLSGTPLTLTDPFLLRAAIGFRLLLLLAIPALSDDYARFVWDGKLLLNGINPFRYLPSELMVGGATNVPVDQTLYERLNSPNYYTVYPPLNQAIFALSAWLSPGNLLGSVLVMRLVIVLAEVGTLWLLPRLLARFGQEPHLYLLYALNPLVILELTGNVHFEGVMIFFVLLALWVWVRFPMTGRPLVARPLVARRVVLSAGAFALGICTKLLPLMLLPLVVAELGWKRGLVYGAYVLAFVGLLFMPFFDLDMLRNMLASIDLYFRKFEFNASVYYLVRAVGYWLFDYNILSQVGGWLSLLTTAGLVALAFARRYPASVRLLWMLTLYFGMATTIHPWYVTSLVAATVFTATPTTGPFRYPILWSGLVWLSYAAYQHVSVQEKPALLLLEYIPVLLLLFFETKNRRYEAST